MGCCGAINGLDRRFDRKRVRKELKRYEKKGLSPSGRALVQALEERDIAGADVLEIGFGIGALHLELLQAGARSAVGLELSPAYVKAAEELAERVGRREEVEYRLQNIAEDAEGVPEAAVVVMHRVVCCYPDMPGLVRPAAQRAARLLALSYPRDTWRMRLFAKLANAYLSLTRQQFRLYLHSPQAIRASVEESGLVLVSERTSGPWEITLFERSTAVNESMKGSTVAQIPLGE